jgi:hypothetical protein
MISQLTLELPAKLAQRLEGLAAEQKKSVEEVALERLASSVEAAVERPTGTAAAILKAMSEPPHLTSEDVDELERAIEAGRLPVQSTGAFDERPHQ